MQIRPISQAEKIQELDQLTALLELRRSHDKIVLCHGAFDLLHVGHLKHFKAARRHGDLLVVTVTASEYINKGPDRPVFDTALRVEMLAALELVDYVAVIHAPSAIPAIDAVRPDVYVKGGEYAKPENDITGKIKLEVDTVEKHGGQVVYTHEETYSSSNLLNRHFGAHNAEIRAYLDSARNAHLEDDVAASLEKIADLRIVVVGETIIDRYVYVHTLGKAAKENIIATLRQGEETFAGGAIAATAHLRTLCRNVELVTLVGGQPGGHEYDDLIHEALGDDVGVTLVRRQDGPTVRKSRFVEPTYMRKLFEVYDMNDEPLPDTVRDHFEGVLAEKIADADAVIVCDFGHGLIQPSTVAQLESRARFLAVNAQSNAGNIGFNLITKYRDVDLVCIDALEARLATTEKHVTADRLPGMLRERLHNCANVIVTSGKAGCYLTIDGGEDGLHIPSFGNGVIDTVGAGDAFFVVAASLLAGGASVETAAFMGNVAGALKIGIVGHRRSITKLELQRYLNTILK